MGSKARIAEYILPIILDGRKKDQWYVEPFVGGANMIDKVHGNRMGADVDENTIDALLVIQNHLDMIPTSGMDFTESDYKCIRSIKRPLRGFFGYAYSYGGKWMGGWGRDSAGRRDYVAEAYRNATEQSPKLSGVKFVCSSYDSLEIPPNSIIYCDPPYASTTAYKTGAFDHPAFWQWCRDTGKAGHSVFVSEYNAPEDFECLWEGTIVSSLTKDTGSKKAVERLFMHKSIASPFLSRASKRFAQQFLF